MWFSFLIDEKKVTEKLEAVGYVNIYSTLIAMEIFAQTTGNERIYFGFIKIWAPAIRINRTQ